MEKKSFVLNVLLAVVLGAGLLVGIVWSAIQPNVVLSNLDVPAMAALVLIALLIEYLWKGTEKRAWAVQIVLAAVTFAVLPFAAGYAGAGIKLTVCGTAYFAVLTWLFYGRKNECNMRSQMCYDSNSICYVSCMSVLYGDDFVN